MRTLEVKVIACALRPHTTVSAERCVYINIVNSSHVALWRTVFFIRGILAMLFAITLVDVK